MIPKWFGDSYDIVKRYFVQILNQLGYEVAVDPMLTGEWDGLEETFYKFLNVLRLDEEMNGRSALLLDPDTGIGSKATQKHVTIKHIFDATGQYDLVFSFDQSFSRGGDVEEKMKDKLRELKDYGADGFYYDSHARFLFAARRPESLNELEKELRNSGLPRRRIVRV